MIKQLPDCEISDGQDLKKTSSKKLENKYQESCPDTSEDTTNDVSIGFDDEDKSKDTSDAHGWSAIHTMTATVLPMALLWV